MKKLLLAMAACLCGFSVLAEEFEIPVTGDANLSSLLTVTPTAEDTLVITATAEDATLTLDSDVVVAKLTVTSTAGTKLTLTSSGTPAGAFDFSGAKGELYVNFDTGSAAVTSGADTYFSYAGTGKLTVPADSRATLTADDVWKDTFTTSAHNSLSMTDTSRIRVMPASGSTGTNTGTPFGTMNDKVKGVFELAGPNSAMTIFQVDRKNHFEISSDFEVTAIKLAGINDNSGTDCQTIDFVRGGSLFVNAANDFTLQATKQTRVALNVLHGCFKSPSCVMTLGTAKHDNKIATRHYYRVGGSEIKGEEGEMEFKGLKSATTYTSNLDIATNGIVKLGSGGLDFTGSNVNIKLNMAGGTLQFTENASCKVGHADGMNVLAPSTLAVTKGTTLTMAAAITGTGSLTIEATGEGEEAAIVDLGTIRTDTPLVFGDGVKLALKLTDLNETIALNATKLDGTKFDATEFVLTDPTGASIDTSKIQVGSNGNGGVTITASVPTLTLARDADFTTDGNWSSGIVPTSGNIVIKATEDVTITLPETVTAETHAYAIVKVTGGGTVAFAGNGMLSAETFEVEGDSTLVQSGKCTMTSVAVGAGSTYVLDGTTEDPGLTVTEKNSGDGAVVSRGTVVMAAVHEFKGGMTVEAGGKLPMAEAFIAKEDMYCYGALGGKVTVEAGGCVDMAGTKDTYYSFMIAGDGVDGSGAMLNERDGTLANNKAQTVRIALAGDAVIDTTKDWGLINKGYASTALDFGSENFKLTKKGVGTFWLANATASSAGTIAVQEGVLYVYKGGDLKDVTIELDGEAVLNLQNTPGALARIKIAEDATGVQITGMNHLNRDVPLELAGGTLKFAASDALSLMNVNMTASSTIQIANGETLTIGNDVEIAASDNATLTFAAANGGTATVDFGTSRPMASLAFGAGVNVVVRLAEEETFFTLKAPGLTTENLIVYDAAGAQISSDNISSELSEDQSTVTFYTSIPVLQPTGDKVSFTSSGEWSAEEYPTRGNFIVETKQSETVTVDLIGVPEGCKYNAVTVKGGGTLQFVNGALAVNEFVLDENSTLVQSGCLVASGETAPMSVVLNEGATYVVDAGDRTADDPFESKAVISGAGKVVTRGNVCMAAASTFTGGLTAESGILSLTNNQGFGGSGATAFDAWVTVSDGACVDVKGTGGYCYAFKIAGKGVKTTNEDGTESYSGALMHSAGSSIASGTDQIWCLELAADAMIMTAKGDGSGKERRWGLRGDYKKGAELRLNGYALTVAGNGDRFWIVDTMATTPGTLRFTDATVMCVAGDRQGIDLSQIDLIFEDQAQFGFEKAYTTEDNKLNLGETVSFLPGTNGVSVYYTNADMLKYLDGKASLTVPFVDPATLKLGDQYALLSVKKLTSDKFSTGVLRGDNFKEIHAGGRYTIEQTASAVIATVSELRNFWHYDFDKGYSLAAGLTAESENAAVATDSRYTMTETGGENATPKWIARPCGGKSVGIFYTSGKNRFIPWWGDTSEGLSPFAVGQFTSTVVVRPQAGDDDRTVVWSWGDVNNKKKGVALITEETRNAFSVVAWEDNDSSAVKTLATIENVPNFASAYHFVAVMITPEGTTLQVDGVSTFEQGVLPPTGIPNSGQLGSVNGKGSALGDAKPNAPGMLIADWQVYDAALTDKELAALRRKYRPSALMIIVR